ncbi:DNA-processing protein DprA [Streptomyces sp. ME03-5684b]|uniref:DNA-processing protein DprA n=1 Tax=Streptomyces sp. ME03-5684b TaxID=3028681 RepID=UPI0029B51230|nr:DNA-processing protein DprA [Streptomyces sp. ME03-5684b]MDX3321107.1 DNA-processing protein DprA [Streptomyces sp. ME03-5684b]
MPAHALSERAARAALAAHFTPGQLSADLTEYTPAEVWDRRVRIDGSGRLAHYRPHEELAQAELTCPFVIPSDQEWPTALADLGPSCPLGLWVRGRERLPRLTGSAVAVTGNRVPTEQAVARAHDFATALAEADHTVTATLAYGVDSTAHQAAAETGRASLAVLPRGLDGAHPHAHAPLLRSILDSGGAAVSLYRPGTEASGATLKASAALLAALARAVILVEALDHVVAMHAAETAVGLHRPLLAAPATGDVRSSGNARLIDKQLAVNSPDPRLALALPHARVARAGDVADGDLLLAAVGKDGADYFTTPYIAHPEPFDPSCKCGVCCLVTKPGEVVVLSQGDPWESCDPWPADDRLLIVSAQRLTDRPLEE